MNEFKRYLQLELKFRESTITGHCGNVARFIQWMKTESHLDAGEIGYNDLLAYIQREKQKGIQPASINIRLASITHYFEFLKHQGEVSKNPAKTVRVKDTFKKIIESPLSVEQLQELYKHYSGLQKTSIHPSATELAHQRNIVMLGLLVYQGVHGGELQKIEVGHISLEAGTVYIPSTARCNSRTLPLMPAQILHLHEYLQQIRLYLKPIGAELFPGSIYNTINRLVEELQGINPTIRNVPHIRGSVIISWLKQHNKRQVQYMAGHKYISSTEAYAIQDNDALQDELSKHRPFG